MPATHYLVLSTVQTVSFNDIGNGYIREFIKNGAKFIDYDEMYLQYGSRKSIDYLFQFIAENNIQVLIYQADSTDFRFDLDFFRSLQSKVFVVMMVGDVEHYFDDRDIYYAQCSDLLVVYNYYSKYRFEHYGINAISFYSSYDKDKFFKINSVEKSIDVSFVGQISGYEDRKEFISYISAHGLAIETFGRGSGNGEVTLHGMVEIFNRSKINVNFSGSASKNPLNKRLNIDKRVKQIKGRMAEIALCGGFVLSENAPGTGEVFCTDKEIAVFYSKEDLLDKIRYYLAHEDERESIAKRGYLRALNDYETSLAIPRLINTIENFRIDKVKRLLDVYIDGRFIKNYTTYRSRMIVKLLRQRKWALLYEELLIILKNRKLNLAMALKTFVLGVFPFLKTCYLRVSNVVKH